MAESAPLTDISPEARTSSSGQRLLQVIGVAILGLILAWGVRSLDGQALLSAIDQSNWRLLLVAAGINLVVVALQALRWRVLLESLAPVSYLRVAGAMLVSFATSSIVPARAGELVRVHLMARDMKIRRAAVAGATLLDHVVNGITIVPLFLVVPFIGEIPAWMQKGIVIALVVVCSGGLLVWISADPTASPAGHFMARVRKGLGGARSPGTMLRAAVISVAAWFAEVGVVWFSLRAFDAHASVGVAVLTLISVNMALAIPSPPGNFGTLEVGAVVVLVALGMSREKAVAFALAYHLLQLVSIWLLLPLAWRWTRRSKPALAEDSSQAAGRVRV